MNDTGSTTKQPETHTPVSHPFSSSVRCDLCQQTLVVHGTDGTATLLTAADWIRDHRAECPERTQD